MKTDHCGLGKDAPLKHQLMELFWVLGPAFTRWAESHMTAPDLTPQRIRLLVLLSEHGPMKMGALRDELGVTAATITALVDGMEQDHMVVRRPHATDRRAIMIALTPKMEKRLDKDCAECREKVSGLFSSFSKADQEQFIRHLQHMRRALVERNILEESDSCPQAKGKQKT